MGGALGNRRGFTLTEILVVVGILVLLTAIVLPNINRAVIKSRMNRAVTDIESMEIALASYHADFGTYPGDVFPTEDINNNGVLDPGEDIGVDVDGDGTSDYDCQADGTPLATPNGRLDRGDGVVNIDDLEWALRTTAKNGPYMESIPLDPWGNKYFYYAPLTRPSGANAQLDFLYITPSTIRTEDADEDGRFDGNKEARDGDAGTNDIGIGQYATTNANVEASFVGKWAGRDNGVLDFGDDDNRNGTLEYANILGGALDELEYGNADISPDGLARNIGYYLFSAGRDGRVMTFSGYEDINLNSQLNAALVNDGAAGSPFSEDVDADTTLDTGYEDTGIDGIPGTKDNSENDGAFGDTGTPDEDFSGPYNATYDPNNEEDTFNIGGDDINSWNKARPWENNTSYGG
jgi:prepilin-type N-terminal cleavage/methylation domain-containing protein